MASCSPVLAPLGTAARPMMPLSRVTSASMVGLPRLSRISRARIWLIVGIGGYGKARSSQPAANSLSRQLLPADRSIELTAPAASSQLTAQQGRNLTSPFELRTRHSVLLLEEHVHSPVGLGHDFGAIVVRAASCFDRLEKMVLHRTRTHPKRLLAHHFARAVDDRRDDRLLGADGEHKQALLETP